MTMPRPVKDTDAQDAISGWRHYLCYVQRAGVRSQIKRRYRRRERHEAKRSARAGRAYRGDE